MEEYQKYKNIFAKSYIPNWSEEIFQIKKLKTSKIDRMLNNIRMEKILKIIE